MTFRSIGTLAGDVLRKAERTAMRRAETMGAARQGSSEPRAAEGVSAASLTDAEEEGTSGETVNDVPVYIAPRTGKRAATPTRREISGTSVGEPNEKGRGAKPRQVGRNNETPRQMASQCRHVKEPSTPKGPVLLLVSNRCLDTVNPPHYGASPASAVSRHLVLIDGGLHHAPPSTARSGELDMPARLWGSAPA